MLAVEKRLRLLSAVRKDRLLPPLQANKKIIGLSFAAPEKQRDLKNNGEVVFLHQTPFKN